MGYVYTVRVWRVSLLIILSAFLFTLQSQLITDAFAAEDKTVAVDSENAEMNAAISKARASIAGFWDKLSNHAANEEGFAVKLKLSDGTNTEHFWCGTILGTPADTTCVIDNAPEAVKTVQFGQRIPIDADLISDWMYLRDGRIVGGETIRVLLNYLPPEEASDLRARLSED